VGEQFGATRQAFRRLVGSHVDLAKTEMAGIGGQIARMLGLGCFAIAVVLLMTFVLVIGSALFLAEWLFGSMGWALLHSALLFPGIAIAAGLAAVGVSGQRLAVWFGVALLIGLGIAVVLGLHLLNQAYASVGDAVFAGIDPAYRTIVAGMLVGSIVLALVAVIPAIGLGGGMAFALVLLGVVLGALLGGFTAITFDWGPAAALGLATAYLAWIGLMSADAARTGIDTEALKNRFIPSQTIDTTKETIEWLKRRMPRGNES
jgi:hypothetical protein